tara:strand:+ start:513 stop:2720 length:2208 start_codon:yes stop_codon:yes gene_type:complete
MSWKNILKSPVKGRHILGEGKTGLKSELYQLMGLDITMGRELEELNTKLDAIETSYPKVKEQATNLKNEMEGKTIKKPDYFSNPPLSIANLYDEKGEFIPLSANLKERYFKRLDYIVEYLSPEKQDDRNLSGRESSIIKVLLSDKNYVDLNKYLIGEVSYNRLKFVNDKVLVKVNVALTKNKIEIRKSRFKKLMSNSLKQQFEQDLKDKPELLGYNIDDVIFTFDSEVKDGYLDNIMSAAKGDSSVGFKDFKIQMSLNGIKKKNITENGKFWVVKGEGWVTKDNLTQLTGAKLTGKIKKTVFADVMGYRDYVEFDERTISAKKKNLLTRNLKINPEVRPSYQLEQYYDLIVQSNAASKSDYEDYLHGSGEVPLSIHAIEYAPIIDFMLKNKTAADAERGLSSLLGSFKRSIPTQKMKLILEENDRDYKSLTDIKNVDIDDAAALQEDWKTSNLDWSQWLNNINKATDIAGLAKLDKLNGILDVLGKTSLDTKDNKLKSSEKIILDELKIDNISSEQLEVLSKTINLYKNVKSKDKDDNVIYLPPEIDSEEEDAVLNLGNKVELKPLDDFLSNRTSRIKNALIIETEDTSMPYNLTKLGSAIMFMIANKSNSNTDKINEEKINVSAKFLEIIEIGYQYDTMVNNDDTLMDEFMEFNDDNEIDSEEGKQLSTIYLDRYDKIREALLGEIDKSMIYVLENNITRNKRGGVRVLEWFDTELPELTNVARESVGDENESI